LATLGAQSPNPSNHEVDQGLPLYDALAADLSHIKRRTPGEGDQPEGGCPTGAPALRAASTATDWARERLYGTASPTKRLLPVTATPRAVELATAAAEAAADKLADDIVAYDVSEQLVITDVFLLCSGANDRQVRSIIDAVEETLRGRGAKPVRREGEREGRWVLLDYLDVVVHVQHVEERVYYSLERLWKDCPLVPLPSTAPDRRGQDTMDEVAG
jgi:ribosome-associated protein